jgi:hypothetical protein
MILFFFVSISTARVYGYYEGSQTLHLSNDETSIKILETIRSKNGMHLVPTGVILGVNDTEEISFTYKIFIQEGIEFNYSIQNIMINDEIMANEINNLFIFEFEIVQLENESIQVNLFDSELDGNYYEINVTLSMSMPTVEQYDQIAGEQLEFTFTLENEFHNGLMEE